MRKFCKFKIFFILLIGTIYSFLQLCGIVGSLIELSEAVNVEKSLIESTIATQFLSLIGSLVVTFFIVSFLYCMYRIAFKVSRDKTWSNDEIEEDEEDDIDDDN